LGSGLRPDIWDEFKSRFNIPLIAECFGATEGPSGTWNILNRPGCVGRWSPLTVRKLYRLLPKKMFLLLIYQ